MPKNKNNDLKLYPLRKFVDDGPYNLTYLSNLVQRKKLKAKKVGRNYFTCREWFNNYLEAHGKNEYVKKEKIAKLEQPVEEFNLEALSEKIADRILTATKGKPEIKEKIIRVKKLRLIFSRLIPKFWVYRLTMASAIVLIFSVSLNIYQPEAGKHLASLMDVIYLQPEIQISKLLNFNKKDITKIEDKNIDQTSEVFKTETGTGRVAGVSEASQGKSLVDEEMIYREMEESINYFKNSFTGTVSLAANKLNNLYLALVNFIYPTEFAPVEETKLADEEIRGQGAVIVPFTDDQDAQEIKQKVEQMFSDKVIVETDESNRAGIVKPVFGSEVASQEYLYMMVPVAEE